MVWELAVISSLAFLIAASTDALSMSELKCLLDGAHEEQHAFRIILEIKGAGYPAP